VKIVLDTNVLVSGLLSPFGMPAEIVRMVSIGALDLCYDVRILTEYRQVLLRSKFSFAQHHVEALLDQIEAGGHLVGAHPLPDALPDPDDEVFLAVALAGQALCLVTGNLRHYPLKSRQGMRVVSPAQFLELMFRLNREAVCVESCANRPVGP
jgi:putative PIN family toxin of toxin-antitoxin system